MVATEDNDALFVNWINTKLDNFLFSRYGAFKFPYQEVQGIHALFESLPYFKTIIGHAAPGPLERKS
jgi:hypothetical protein